jgi:hypothetical protein
VILGSILPSLSALGGVILNATEISSPFWAMAKGMLDGETIQPDG